MTKKDYIIIANALKELPANWLKTKHFEQLIEALSRSFKADNPRFDKTRFIEFILK